MSQLRKKTLFFQYLKETKGGLKKKHVEIRNYHFLFFGKYNVSGVRKFTSIPFRLSDI